MQSFNKIHEYSRCVCDQIRWKKAHSVISEEIENHLMDQRDAYIADGADEITAINNAVAQMGDPIIIGTQLDRTHRPKTQWNMILLVVGLLCIGLFSRFFIVYPGDLWRMPTQIIFTVIGVGVMIAAYFSDFTLIGKYPKTIYFAIQALSIAAIIISPVVNGRLYYASFMPLLFPLALTAILFVTRNKGYWGIILCGISYLLPAGIALYTQAISGFFLFTVSGLVILSFAMMKDWFRVDKLYGYLLIFMPTIAAFLFAGVSAFAGSYRWIRLQVALDPSVDPDGAGYVGTVTRALLGGSKLIGQGTMPAPYVNSTFFPLSKEMINTDYLLTYLIFNIGWIAFIITAGILLYFIIRGFMLCFRQKSGLGLFISISVMLTFSIQVIGYVIANLGFQVTSPISLPLISYGKIATLFNLALIGLMLSVFRTGDVVNDKRSIIIRPKDKFATWNDGKLIISFGSNKKQVD